MFIAAHSSGYAVTLVNETGAATNSTHSDNATTVLPGTKETQTGSDELRFTTYNLYLPQVAVHEYLHCFTHPNYSKALGEPRLDSPVRHNLVEDSTQYLPLQTPFDRRGDRSGKYSSVYVEEAKFIGKIVDDVGVNTLKKAYFSGDRKAIGQVRDTAMKRAEILLRG